MRAHDYEHDGPEVLRPKPTRPHAPDAAVRAVAAGRWDAVTAGGLLALQRAAGNRAVAAALADRDRAAVREVAGGGAPPQAGVRAGMQARLGRGVGGVRVHHDVRAEEPTTAVDARACMAGPGIVFQLGRSGPPFEEGRVGLAHELAPVVQQRSAVSAATPSRVAPAGDPDELQAGRVAGDAAGGAPAQPVASAQAPLIQRKAFIGADHTSAKPVRFTPATYQYGLLTPMSYRKYESFVAVEEGEGNLGDGERNVRAMVTDGKSRYFHAIAEFRQYANRGTKDIGYVDREKTWVRLPSEFLVLGEEHNRTTLMDLVAATGTEKYLYEGSQARPSPYLHPGQTTDEVIRGHALEEGLPKLVIGLTGIQQLLQGKLQALDRSGDWKKRVLRQAGEAAALADPEASKRKYEDDLAAWSSTWEAGHQGAKARGLKIPGGLGARRRGNIEDALGVLEDNPPRDRPYDKDAIYTVMARMALEELRTARDPNGLIKRFYANNKKVIEETIEQLNAGLPVELTRMFLKMATGKFNLGRLIGLLKSAAESEFTASGVTDVSTEEGYGTKETGAAGGPAMGKLRDSYMLHRILAAKEANYVLAGVGDAHRENLEKVLKKRDPNILVMPSSKFYAEQYQRYPDRD